MIVRYDSVKLRNKLQLLTGDNRDRGLRFLPAASADATETTCARRSAVVARGVSSVREVPTGMAPASPFRAERRVLYRP